MSIRLLERTASWIAVDKPAGMVVIPARQGDPKESLWHILEDQLDLRLWAVHRIDRDTSGVVLFALDSSAHRSLSMAFERGEIEKTYLAFIRGAPRQKKGSIKAPLHPARRGKARPASPGEPGSLQALTEFRLLQRWDTGRVTVSLLEVHPRTGRHHQIRVHLKYLDLPLLVDPLYGHGGAITASELGNADDTVICARTTLHASQISFIAPDSGQRINIRSTMPPDLSLLKETLERLSRSRG